VCALASFGFVLAAHASRAAGQAEAPRKAELIQLVQSSQSNVNTLDAAVRRLRSELAAAELGQARTERLSADDARRLAQLVDAAAASPVAGPGLTVTLSDSNNVPTGTADSSAYRIHDQDIQLVVNSLFAAGADAVAVNGQRIGATTSIRSAGDTVVVDLRPLVPPYRVDAIGADRDVFLRSDISRRFARWTTEFGLGFDVTSQSHLNLAAFSEPVTLSAASPAGG